MHWFERHLFKTTQIDICHLGFLVGKCPTDTHRATLQQTINDKIATLMMGQATDDYYREKSTIMMELLATYPVYESFSKSQFGPCAAPPP
jgi:hypothetical protein